MAIQVLNMQDLIVGPPNPNAAYPCIDFKDQSPKQGEAVYCKYYDGFWQMLYFMYRQSTVQGMQERSVHVPRKDEDLHAPQTELECWVHLPRWVREEYNI